MELGVDATWPRPRHEEATPKLVDTGSGRERLDAFVNLAVLANRYDLLSATDPDEVRIWQVPIILL